MSAATPPDTGTTTAWKIDSVHSNAQFKVRHMMISNVKGEFGGITGTLKLDKDLSKSSVEASINASTLNTGDAQRDGHLKGADFFNVEQFPTLSFRSTRITKREEGAVTVTGDLTVRGVSVSTTFDVEGPTAPIKDPWGNIRIGLSATTKINRKDFGLNWNTALETGGFVVGDDVTITLDVEFIKT